MAGNLVNIHVRIKPLASVSGTTDRKEDGEATRRERATERDGEEEGVRGGRRQNLVSDVRPRSIILSLLRHFRGNRIPRPTRPEGPRSFFFFSLL